jgi:hypothetical protein
MPTNMLSLSRELRQEILFEAILLTHDKFDKKFRMHDCMCPPGDRSLCQFEEMDAHRSYRAPLPCPSIAEARASALRRWIRRLQWIDECIGGDIKGAMSTWIKRVHENHNSKEVAVPREAEVAELIKAIERYCT